MLSCQLAPLRGELEFVIRRCGVFERMVNAVVIKKHPEHLMPRCQGGIDKLIRGIPSIGLVRAGVNLNGEFHWVLWLKLFLIEEAASPILLPIYRDKNSVTGNTRLLQNRTQSAFRHIAWMIGYRCITAGAWVVPNLVAACGLPVELKA